MTEPKTRPTDMSVDGFIAAIPDETVREDCRTLVQLMRRVTDSEPQMWGERIIGFGEYQLKYASGRMRTWPCLSFAPRKRELALYVVPTHSESLEPLLQQLGKHRITRSCLYIKRLSNVDMDVLEQICRASLDSTQGCSRQ